MSRRTTRGVSDVQALSKLKRISFAPSSDAEVWDHAATLDLYFEFYLFHHPCTLLGDFTSHSRSLITENIVATRFPAYLNNSPLSNDNADEIKQYITSLDFASYLDG